MSKKVEVRLLRAYLWIEEDGSEVSYGPGHVEIPQAMAEGLQREKVDIGLPQTTQQESDVHPRIFAQREADASERTVKAAVALADKFGIATEALQAEAEQPEVQQVLRNEAVAEFLELLVTVEPLGLELEEVQASVNEVVQTTEAVLLARIEAIDGIGPKTMELIRKGLAESSVEVAVETTVEPLDEPLDDKG